MCHTQGKGTWSSRLSETAPALPSRIFRARVSQADCGQGQLAIWFSPFTTAYCSHLSELWTTASVRDHDSSRHFPLPPTHLLKEMIQSKLPGLAICFLMLTVRKTQVKISILLSLSPALSQGWIWFSPFLTLLSDHWERYQNKHLFNKTFPPQSHMRAALGSMPSYWPVRNSIPVTTVGLEVCTSNFQAWAIEHNAFWIKRLTQSAKTCAGRYIFQSIFQMSSFRDKTIYHDAGLCWQREGQAKSTSLS